MPNPWTITETGFRAPLLRHYEGLFTLGNGSLHIRGSLEEHIGGAPQNVSYTRLPGNVTSEKFRRTTSEWGTFVPGIYAKHPLLNNEIVNLPWPLGLAPIVDGERLDLARCEVIEHERTLDLRAAVLRRRTVWRTQSGAVVTARFERFVAAGRARLCIQRLVLRAERDAEVRIEAGIDADVRTNGFDHIQQTRFDRSDPARMACTVRTDAGDEIATVCSLSASAPADWGFNAGERAAALAGAWRLGPDEDLTIEKRSAVSTSRDGDGPDGAASLDRVAGRSFEDLLEQHAAAWAARWAVSDVTIEPDEDSQRAMRASVYHLMRCAPPDGRVAIDAKGYAGQAYWGRFFWDTEMFLLPFFAHTDPDVARRLVEFRLNTLDGARRNAARYGCPGARYPWESDPEGNECCPGWQYADHEIHVTGDVAYGMLLLARATGDESFPAGRAAEALVEMARFWMSRINFDDLGATHLRGVMGPDEYTLLKDDNAFTNRMAALALTAAAEVGEAAGATRAEIEAFRRAASSLVILRDEASGLVWQCDGFDRMAEPDFETWWIDRSQTLGAQVPQERLYRTKCLKQADVLMLMQLFPSEFTDAQVHAAWRYYLPYTTHDSSLSAGTHGIIACRLANAGVAGMDEQAWRFWMMSRDIDLDESARGAERGVHIANAGALWQMAVQGFAGVGSAMWDDVLRLRPRLPKRWTRLNIPLAWRGARVKIELTRDAVRIEHEGGEPVRVALGDDDPRVLTGGRSAELTTRTLNRPK